MSRRVTPAVSGRPGWLRWLPWAAMVLVAVAALAIGTQVSRPSLDQRVTALAGQVRCPVCNGETAAQSNTPPSVEIRTLIRQWLVQGDSASQVKAKLVDSYGPSILETPQASGVGVLVWVLPALAVVIAVGGLTLAFRHWRRRLHGGESASAADREMVARALGGDEGGVPA